MLRIIKIVIFFILISNSIHANDGCDSCNCEVDRILKTFESLKSKYIEVANEKLLYYLNKDSILKRNFLEGDSINFKNLKIKINPILKLDYEARNFKFGENICKYFLFDTLDYKASVTYFLNNKWIFRLTPLSNECDKALSPGGFSCSKDEKCTGYYFTQRYYLNSSNFMYYGRDDSRIDTILFNSFTFDVNGLDSYIIKDSYLKWYGYNQSNFYFDNPNEYIKEIYNEEWIRYCARKCCVGGTPWWRFWDWDIFLKEPVWQK